ncbi:MAG: hypothetical protein ACE5GE_06550 [Phycisphaerae bacterium]
MASLRHFHLVFMLFVIVATDMFGGWAVHQYHLSGQPLTLAAGIASFLGGFAVIAYAVWFIHKLDRAQIT